MAADLGRLSDLRNRGPQAPQFLWRNLELQFNFLAHHRPDLMHPYII